MKNGIIAIYLAAGKSSRMGENKLSLPLSTCTIGNSALRTALSSSLEHVLVVSKKEDSLEWVDPSLFCSPFSSQWSHVVCEDAEKGQAHSLKRGFLSAMSVNPKGIMVLLADQPYLSKATIEKVIMTYISADQQEFVAACFEGIPRPPVIFAPGVIPKLMKLQGDVGARKIFKELEGMVVEFSNARDFYDIDTKEDYERVIGGEWK
ncbi:nucleotidyltransferase family protein [Robertmurraya korlensis]|uniref:nucleotidyltransferase family protein n=1 Tax=Robertmurraya korlensis TaxID=519977 RepID=UPI00203C4442|nr:nucleotidyltransferase family protein [Robertmurraya korlensis]MCM3600491.1 nucleotidyltransferase family protein [Robertmurraya korlensis]